MILMSPRRDLSSEEATVYNMTEMSVKLQHIQSLNNQRKLNLQVEPGNQNRETFSWFFCRVFQSSSVN